MKSNFIYRTFLLLLLVASLGACEKDVSDKLSYETSNQLVVSSFISPQDTSIQVHLQRTQSAIGQQLSQEQLKVTDAVVNLSDGAKTIQLKYEARRNIYRAKSTLLPIVGGKTYSLQVTTPNGWKATATATVPATTAITIKDYSIRTEDYNPGWGTDQLQHYLTFKWQDAPGQENYYRTFAYWEAPNPNNPNFPMQRTPSTYSQEQLFMTDAGKDGQELSSGEILFYSEKPDMFPRPFNLHLLLTVSDRAFYLYHQSVFKQEENDGNPFAEPTLLYTNITGGLGIFAAHNLVHVVRQVN